LIKGHGIQIVLNKAGLYGFLQSMEAVIQSRRDDVDKPFSCGGCLARAAFPFSDEGCAKCLVYAVSAAAIIAAGGPSGAVANCSSHFAIPEGVKNALHFMQGLKPCGPCFPLCATVAHLKCGACPTADTAATNVAVFLVDHGFKPCTCCKGDPAFDRTGAELEKLAEAIETAKREAAQQAAASQPSGLLQAPDPQAMPV
jgi:hypothetical protein